jgi:site-specific DNA recombinase
LEVGAAVIEAALDLLNDPEELYRRSTPKYRRLLNQAIFVKVYVDDNEVTDHVMREPFAQMHTAQASIAIDGQPIGRRRRPEPAIDQTEADLLVAALSGGGSSKTAMVGEGGFEPPTSCSQSTCATAAPLPVGVTKRRSSCGRGLRFPALAIGGGDRAGGPQIGTGI